MMLVQFGQDDVGTEDNPIRITPGGVLPALPQPDSTPDQVIDIAPSAAQETPATRTPIRLPPLLVTLPKKTGLSSGQIGGLVALAGVLAGGVIALIVVKTTPKSHRRRRYA